MFEGAVETTGNVIIGRSAKVVADIKANAVQIWGAVKGTIVAAGRLEIMDGGRLWGNIRVTSLFIDEGAIFRGQSFMDSEEPEPLLIEGEVGDSSERIVDAELKTEPVSPEPVVEGYCVKCKSTACILDPNQITMKNGKPATQGSCPKCGTKVFRIGG